MAKPCPLPPSAPRIRKTLQIMMVERWASFASSHCMFPSLPSLHFFANSIYGPIRMTELSYPIKSGSSLLKFMVVWRPRKWVPLDWIDGYQSSFALAEFATSQLDHHPTWFGHVRPPKPVSEGHQTRRSQVREQGEKVKAMHSSAACSVVLLVFEPTFEGRKFQEATCDPVQGCIFVGLLLS